MQQDFLKTSRVEVKEKTPLKLQVDELLAVIEAFSNLLDKETDSLKRVDFDVVDRLQEQKKLFAKRYDAKVKSLSTRRDEIIKLDLTTRETLKSARLKFNKCLDENMHALINAQESAKRLVNHILDSARKVVAEETKVNYSKLGKSSSYKSAGTSLSYDQTL